jgi:DNA-binding NarL/FixJ family response regulator
MKDRPHMVLVERSPRWSILLRRSTPTLGFMEARSLALADDLLAEHPSAFVAVVAAGDTAVAAIEQIGRWQLQYPNAAFAVLTSDCDDEFASAWHEAGAQIVIRSPLELPRLARIVARHGQTLERTKR